MAIRDNIKNGLLTSSTPFYNPTNIPQRYTKDKKTVYYESTTKEFALQYAQYSTDYIEAEIEGLYAGKPYEWTKVLARLSDIVKPTAAIQRNYDDYKMIQIVKPSNIDYIPLGAKIRTMGNYWIATNSSNISDAAGIGLVRRCNSVWNYLDFYGNVKSEPLVLDSYLSHFNTNNPQETAIMIKGYFNVLCQYNEATKQLQTNSRMILGRNLYIVTGYSDFMQEFTGDYDSVHMIEFSIRFEEINPEIDDMVNHVAGGLAFAWDIFIHGNSSVSVGERTQLNAVSVRTGIVVSDTPENPITYTWVSSDENVATVDENGFVTGVSEGECDIICTLVQNLDKQTVYHMKVAGLMNEPHVAFLSTIPKVLNIYDSVDISAAYYINGEATDEKVSWGFAGAKEGYNFTYKTNDNTLNLSCWRGNVTPLVVTATCNGESVSAEIELSSLISAGTDAI